MGESDTHDGLRATELREYVQKDLRSSFEATIDQQVDRYLELDHQFITGGHYFAAASNECTDLYVRGYFISAVMMSHAVNEAILKFVAGRNEIKCEGRKEKLIDLLASRCIVTSECAQAARRIWGSYRNDVHHMNPQVASVDFKAIAKRNLQDLATIGGEIFGVDIVDRGLRPHQPKYWDVREDGMVTAFLTGKLIRPA
jgi:hypothetical protein